MPTRLPEPSLDSARAAAVAFWREQELPPERLAELEGAPPVLGPVAFERDGQKFTAYRWLGGGRGGAYVQVEIDARTGEIAVHGSAGEP